MLYYLFMIHKILVTFRKYVKKQNNQLGLVYHPNIDRL